MCFFNWALWAELKGHSLSKDPNQTRNIVLRKKTRSWYFSSWEKWALMFSCFLPMLRFPWVSFHAFESRVFSVYRRHKFPDNQWHADERTYINNISNISPLLSVTLKLVQLEAKIFSKVNSGAAEKLYFQKLYFQKSYFQKWIGVAEKLWGKNSPISGLTSTS